LPPPFSPFPSEEDEEGGAIAACVKMGECIPPLSLFAFLSGFALMIPNLDVRKYQTSDRFFFFFSASIASVQPCQPNSVSSHLSPVQVLRNGIRLKKILTSNPIMQPRIQRNVNKHIKVSQPTTRLPPNTTLPKRRSAGALELDGWELDQFLD
jgi:hypothetical protein